MLNSLLATKLSMTQAWSDQGKRLAVTRLKVSDNIVIDQKNDHTFEIGYGQKKLKNMPKPLRSKLEKSGFSNGVKELRGLKTDDTAENQLKIGDVVTMDQVFEVGDVVKVQGVTKGRGFTGVIKRHGFHGGPRTHGQSDRMRAPGSIGAGTSPGRVWPGKKMAGKSGKATKTIQGLVILHIDQANQELWLSGPVPGYNTSMVQVIKTGQKKEIKLNKAASGIIDA